MAFVETERHGQVMVIRMNRPERLNALGHELRTGLAEAWCEFRDSDQLEVAVFTGTGRAFCAGEDLGWSSAPICASPCAAPSSKSPRPSVGCSAAITTGSSRGFPNPSPPRW